MVKVPEWVLVHPGSSWASPPLMWFSVNHAACIIRGASHCGLAICIKKYLKAKEELWKLKYFTMQTYNLQKNLQKKPKSFKIL
jgi:hypothetical protein